MRRVGTLAKWIMFFCGVECIAFGTCCTAQAGLGTSAVASVPYIFSMILSSSYGTTTFFFHGCMFLVQLLILRRKFSPLQFLQLPSLLIFAVLVDLNLVMVQRFSLSNYFEQMLLLLCGCLALGLGIAFQIKSHTIMLPADAAPRVISLEFGLDYTIVKTIIDVSEVSVGALASWLCLDRVVGIKEGTLISALIVGIIVKTCMKLMDQFMLHVKNNYFKCK